MQLVNILQTNLTCTVICAIILFTMRRGTGAPDSVQQTFLRILIGTVALCLSEILAVAMDGTQFISTRFWLYASNFAYYMLLCAVDFRWMIYVRRRLGRMEGISNKRMMLWALPILIFGVLVLTAPLNGFIFTVDENNVYSRGPGVFLHWIVTWGYMLIATGMTIHSLRRAGTRLQRAGILPLLAFMIAPCLCALLQMVFYGLSTTQVGITVSLLIIYLDDNHSLILSDPLTGLNNRRHLDLFLNDCFQHDAAPTLTMVMADLNRFKQINDTFGHAAGDRAMRAVADALKRACGQFTDRLFLCRYGGDEFVIVGRELTPDVVTLLPGVVQDEIERAGLEHSLPMHIEIAIGMAEGVCHNLSEADALLHRADEQMYKEKIRMNKE